MLRGRIERWAEHYDGPRFHALLCDPPYELGFMGRDWDRSGVSFRPETWAALAAHLHPGAFGMAFASSRGWHRLACAIEDAGLVIHPSIFGWAFGNGFPKATRIDTQVDAVAGAKRWEGHRYGLQALKPALEPIIVFQKPYQSRPVEDITATGAGALWIDGGRVATQGDRANARGNKDGAPELPKSGYEGGWGNPGRGWDGQSGRWPANLALVHHPECVRVGSWRVMGGGGALTTSSQNRRVYNDGWGNIEPRLYTRDMDGMETVDDWECHADCPVRAFGEQSGVTKSSGGLTPGVGAGDGRVYSFGNELGANAGGLGDAGTAARFFFQADLALERAEPVFYCAKASRAERDAGLSVYNPHPTVKPIALCRWLATLLLPPAEYAPRRILAPFAGSGSEMIGALLAGWDLILGIELLEENAMLAKARLAWWADRARWGQTEPAVLLSEHEPDNGHQLKLF